MPSGNADRTMSAWVNPTSFEGRNWAQASIGGWGEPERGQKPNMGLSYFHVDGKRAAPASISTALTQGVPAPCPETNGGTSPLPFPGTWFAFTSMAFWSRRSTTMGRKVSKLGTLRTPVSTPVDLGDHGNGRGPFNGPLDEVRFESVARSANWLKLCFENQKPLQSLVGPLVQDGDEFSVSESNLVLKEGASIALSAKAGGARKVYWVLQDGDQSGDSRRRPLQLYL